MVRSWIIDDLMMEKSRSRITINTRLTLQILSLSLFSHDDVAVSQPSAKYPMAKDTPWPFSLTKTFLGSLTMSWSSIFTYENQTTTKILIVLAL